MTTRAPRFEIVHTDAGWHARFRATNSRIVWTTEVYERCRGAVRAVELICDSGVYVSPFAAHPEVRWSVTALEVRDIDERYAAPPVVLEPPFYVREVTEFVRGWHSAQVVGTAPFWHDHDYHWRHCYGDECTEGTPPRWHVRPGPHRVGGPGMTPDQWDLPTWALVITWATVFVGVIAALIGTTDRPGGDH